VNEFILQALNGLVVGLSLALVASGLALIFGVLDIINFAHGDFYMLGGYVLWWTLPKTHSFVVGVVLAGLLVGVGGLIMLLLLVLPLLDRALTSTVLATLGLSLILQQWATRTFGGDTKAVEVPLSAHVSIGSVQYPVYNLVIIAVSAAILVAAFYYLKYAKWGIWLRAVAQNRAMAAVLGVPVPRVYWLAFAASSALAGIGGSLLAPISGVYPTVGGDVILNAFVVVVAGGMGNFMGAALIAVLLGEIEALGTITYGSVSLSPVAVRLLAIAVVIVLLVVRSRRQSALVRL
jgi:branched-chain amino acid transport system permease protein